jgi:hypothetical protein
LSTVAPGKSLRCTKAGARPGAQRWHLAPHFTLLRLPQASTSAELSQDSGMPLWKFIVHSSCFQILPFPQNLWCNCGSSCGSHLAQLLPGHLPPPRGVLGRLACKRPKQVTSSKRRGGCGGGMRQLPTAGAAAALRTGTGKYASRYCPLPSDVCAAAYKSLVRSLARYC